MKGNTIECIFIGDKFYNESSTHMSSIYQIIDGRFVRTDWGKISITLKNGWNVNIKPATKEELLFFEEELILVKKFLKSMKEK